MYDIFWLRGFSWLDSHSTTSQLKRYAQCHMESPFVFVEIQLGSQPKLSCRFWRNVMGDAIAWALLSHRTYLYSDTAQMRHSEQSA